MKKKEIITFIIVFAVAIISTIFFLQPHYSIDTVEFLTNGYDRYIQDKFLVDGRIFSVLLLNNSLFYIYMYIRIYITFSLSARPSMDM